jgi:type VI secretion system protein ImpK
MGRLPVALRDTARTVTDLSAGRALVLHDLRRQCDNQVIGLRTELLRCGQPHDVIDDAVYAQCALLDETALKHLSGADRDAWEREPLQLSVFGRNDAGEELLRRIGQRLREPKPVIPLLGIFAAVFALGFKGRHATGENEALAKLTRAIEGRLERAVGEAAPNRSGALVVDPLRRRRRVLSPLAWVLIACMAAGFAWFSIDQWLLSSIAGMAR